MADEQAPYCPSGPPSPMSILQSAHACKARVVRVRAHLDQLLADVRSGALGGPAAQARCDRLAEELRAAADALDAPRPGDSECRD